MDPLYNAYQSYERRAVNGEFDKISGRVAKRSAAREPLPVRFGDLLIRTGLKLKRRYAAGKSMAWSPMTGSKS